jgi:hypothetical protein
MDLTPAEVVSLFGAHSIGRVERVGNAICNYMSNAFFCPSMCPKISESKGLRFAQGWVFDDSPELLDNRYFENMFDTATGAPHDPYENLPHCAALGMTGRTGTAVPGAQNGAFWEGGQYAANAAATGERDQGILRFGVMGLGCVPQAWSPVVDENMTRPCVAGYELTWNQRSQCHEDGCVHRCITDNHCSHVWNDASEGCRSCKLECSDFWKKYASKQSAPFSMAHVTRPGSRSSGDWQSWAYNLRHAVNPTHPSKVEQLVRYRWCKFFGEIEGRPTFGQANSWANTQEPGDNSNADRPGAHLMDTPGPISKRSRGAWYGGPGLVQNMEQFALLHGNPTPIYNLPVDFALLGADGTLEFVKQFGGKKTKWP